MQIKTVALSATLLSLALGAAFALHSNEQEREISNYQGTYTCSPEAIYDPSSHLSQMIEPFSIGLMSRATAEPFSFE